MKPGGKSGRIPEKSACIHQERARFRTKVASISRELGCENLQAKFWKTRYSVDPMSYPAPYLPLLIPQRIYGVQPGGTYRRVNAGDDADS